MKVSIIVPVYNVSKYLRKCLDSLVNQTLKDIEIIIVNDGSPDDSQTIIDEYKKKYKNIKSYIKKNGGLSDARNYGLKHAKGEYIGFVDSDDYVDTTMYEKMYNLAKKEDSDLVTSDFYWIYPNKTVLDSTSENKSKEDLMLSIRVLVCNKLIKRQIIEKNKLIFPLGLRYEDIYFTYTLLPHINKISYLKEPMYYYIQRENSISNNQNEKVRDIFIIFDKLVQYYKENDLYKDNEEILEYLHIRYFLGSSFIRISKVGNKTLRREILNENWYRLNYLYPNWKNNVYLKKLPGKKNSYYRHINKLMYNISAVIFRHRR